VPPKVFTPEAGTSVNGGGGGGAGGAGATSLASGSGGFGLSSSITGTATTYCVGGVGTGTAQSGRTYGWGGDSEVSNANNGVVIVRWLTSAYSGTPTFSGLTHGSISTTGLYSYVVITAGTNGTMVF